MILTYLFLSIFVAAFYGGIALAFLGPRVAIIMFAGAFVASMFWLLFNAGAARLNERFEK